jgi:hypothetical protein
MNLAYLPGIIGFSTRREIRPVLNPLLNFTALTHLIACGSRYEESDFDDEESEEDEDEEDEDDESVANGEQDELEGK